MFGVSEPKPVCGFVVARAMKPQPCAKQAIALVHYRPFHRGEGAWEPACPSHIFPTQERRYIGLEG